MKNIHHFVISDKIAFKEKMLSWASRFNIFCFLDSCDYPDPLNPYNWLMAAGDERSVVLHRPEGFKILKDFYDQDPGWLFGHIGYGITHITTKQDKTGFDDGFFFSPKILLRYANDKLTIETFSEDPTTIFREINTMEVKTGKFYPVHITPVISREQYLETITKIKQHIKRGDCYELNFCQEFLAGNSKIDPLSIFKKLSASSPNPFTSFYRVGNNFCLCASPERFLKKTGSQLYSQPIKGTTKRSNDPKTDEQHRNYLLNSLKEKSENVMIVDLVRNDLSKICSEGSVKVLELFGIYSFPQVHQMISTITGTIEKGIHFTEVLAATFPMGSMTGAPKKRVMELIDIYEENERGLFSGSIGYVTPVADMDFNVVIRSIFYNTETGDLSFRTGGGITFNSEAEAEYEESILKAEAIRNALKDID